MSLEKIEGLLDSHTEINRYEVFTQSASFCLDILESLPQIARPSSLIDLEDLCIDMVTFSNLLVKHQINKPKNFYSAISTFGIIIQLLEQKSMPFITEISQQMFNLRRQLEESYNSFLSYAETWSTRVV